MGYYVIGIGGTGAKCVESLIHVAAAGLIDGTVNILLVDADLDNGHLQRTNKTLQIYRDLYQNFRGTSTQLGKVKFLESNIETTQPQVWTPFGKESRPTLDRLFGYSTMQFIPAGLMDVLYTEKEKSESLNVGFRGHPSIGTAVMADAVNLEQEEPWKEFCSKIANDPEAKIMLMGSIFGGTGAAGLPTLARLLSDKFRKKRGKKFRLGCVLMLPYFSFSSPDDLSKLQAHSEEFLLRSQAALNYYQIKLAEEQEQIYNNVYLLGDSNRPMIPNDSSKDPPLGGRKQCNPAHFLEVYAATAVLHFFEQDMDAPVKTYTIARKAGNELNWDSIPGGEDFELALANLARFSYAYLGFFSKKISKEIEGPDKFRNVTWFVEFIKKDLANVKKPLDRVADYCEVFLGWLDQIHHFKADGFTVALFNTHTYRSESDVEKQIYYQVSFPEGDKYGDLYNTKGWKIASTFEDLSRRLTRLHPKDIEKQGASGLGRFLHALYQECKVNQ